MSGNTLFLRLEGAFQSWGDQRSRLLIRRTSSAPTKSGVVGLLCSALGVSRAGAGESWLPRLRGMRMGVRIDSPGVRWWDFQTVGANTQMRTAGGSAKEGPILTRREYLCDASFLVTLQGDPNVVGELTTALDSPKWSLFLGRKCCPPSRPLLECEPGEFSDTLSALRSRAWRPRCGGDPVPAYLECLYDWFPSPADPRVPENALILYDVPLSFEPPSHGPRAVLRGRMFVGDGKEVAVMREPTQTPTSAAPRPRAAYENTQYRKARKARLASDHHLCVFCKSVATTVQHVTYRRAGGSETQDDLRALCRLCHDAVTMLEYGAGMGIDRIDPEDPEWRERIIKKRQEILKYRSLETRRRLFSKEDVE